MSSIISEISQNLTAFSSINRFMKNNKIAELLQQSNCSKDKGVSCYEIFKFLFCLVFTGKNFYRTLTTKKKKDKIEKDAIYRFMSSTSNNWRKFLLLLSSKQIKITSKLTSEDRKTVLIVDDSLYDRGISKSVELLAIVLITLTTSNLKGLRILTLEWSYWNTFIPVLFAIVEESPVRERL